MNNVNCRGDFPVLVQFETPCSGEYFSVLPHSRWFHSWSSALIFWTLKYSSFKQQKGRKSYKLTCLWVRTCPNFWGLFTIKVIKGHMKSDAQNINQLWLSLISKSSLYDRVLWGFLTISAGNFLSEMTMCALFCSLHLTTLCLQYKPPVVACACIHLASKWSNWEVSN